MLIIYPNIKLERECSAINRSGLSGARNAL